GGGLSSLIDWTAPSSGTYFVQVAGFGSAFGTYSLAASINGPGSGSSMLLSAAASGLSMETDGGGTTASDLASPASASPLFSFDGTSRSPSLGSTSQSAKSLSQATSESSDQNDLALLAWLSNSSGTSQGASSQGNDDPLAAQVSDEPDAVDVAFELLE